MNERSPAADSAFGTKRVQLAAQMISIQRKWNVKKIDSTDSLTISLNFDNEKGSIARDRDRWKICIVL